MSKMLTKQLLLSGNYWVLNKPIVKMFGIETAFFLANLAEAENMMADDQGWFYQTSDTIEEMTTLSRYKQDKAIEELEQAGILHKKVRGIPAKRYFKLDYEVLSTKIVNFLQTSVKKTNNQEFKKLTTNKESNINKVNKENINSNSPADAERPSIPYKEIIDYLNEKADRRFSHVAESNKKLIRARWNELEKTHKNLDREGLVACFKRVIDNKVADANDPDDFFTEEYLRPSTLFRGSNFDKYLNQVPKTNDSKGYDTSEYEELF